MSVSAFSSHEDPAALEESDPLVERSSTSFDLDRQRWRDYEDGVVEQESLQYDASYVYRDSEIQSDVGKILYRGQFGSSPAT